MSRHILLVDDDPDDQSLFKEALEAIDRSFTCDVAWDGIEALRYLETVRSLPDMIFLDVNMPLMNGLECLEKIKEDEAYRSIPICVMSTSFDSNTMRAAKSGGAMFLTKPGTFNEIIESLKVVLKP